MIGRPSSSTPSMSCRCSSTRRVASTNASPAHASALTELAGGLDLRMPVGRSGLGRAARRAGGPYRPLATVLLKAVVQLRDLGEDDLRGLLRLLPRGVLDLLELNGVAEVNRDLRELQARPVTHLRG